MKKILLASTILVGSAGFAAAGSVGASGEGTFDITGEAGFGMVYNGVSWSLNHYAGFDIAMSGTTSGGLTFGATVGVNAYDTTIDSTFVWISGGFGQLAAGDVDNAVAATVGGIKDVGYSGLGVDNIAEAQRAASAADLLYTGTFGSFSVAASYDTASGDYGLGGKYAIADYTIAAGVERTGAVTGYALSLGGTWGAFGANALYAVQGATASYGLDASYTTGAVTITAAYGQDNGAATTGYGLGVSYDLGGGASVDAGIASVAGVTVADFGINMDF